MSFALLMVLLSGTCWSLVYLDAIRIGIKDKTYAIPFWALALNFAWEALLTLFGYRELGVQAQVGMNAVWLLFDFGILYTYFKYGIKEFPASVSPRWFYLWSVLVILVSLVIQYFFIRQFGVITGGSYTAFLQNLLMSILFIGMLIKRKSSRGQTLLIAVMKGIGTLFPTILFGFVGIKETHGPNHLVLVLGILIFFFDVLYVYLLYRVKQQERSSERPEYII
ncbi:MAG: hypothetical protein JXR71_04975 [Bacteroidales bacterium]|nr:hypothetical protein [Bacteroidales bacterium]